MSSFSNGVWLGKSYNSFTMSDYSYESKEKQKQQIITERDGNYYCTYIVGKDGKKILLKKIPVPQMKEQEDSAKPIESDKAKTYDYNDLNNARTTFVCKQQMQMESANKKNLREAMDILNEYAGIPAKSNKTYVDTL
ncbi:hypothetical protein [Anaerocolumna sp. MB42-C2]|uniref:hypothetical protein n=1 Tax=Anaerocolumna sp. MB42-C2 TaxID=3070997 RepID=UPI0027E205B9|nr:hypothetical protein [Anaerocolumna sp. MB42-C2]WMJ89482.1 hypothetical protein RBU59_08150 [Anaerocolumna sp. MB42-C2]